MNPWAIPPAEPVTKIVPFGDIFWPEKDNRDTGERIQVGWKE